MSAPSISAAPGNSRTDWIIRRFGANEHQMIRTLVPSSVKTLGEDEVEVRISTANVARDGHILIPQGGRLENYKKNPVVLWNHDTDNFPVGRAESISVQSQQIVARVRFPPAGISERAEECRGLIKTGFINGVSVGFDPLDGQPLDPRNPHRGMRITDWDLIEFSFCCVPVDENALVTSRARPGAAVPTRSRRRGAKPMQAATNHCQTALDEHAAFARHHAEIADATQRLDEHRSRLGTALRGLQAAVQTGDNDAAADCHARCMRCMGGINREMKTIGDRHQDATDAYNAVQRSLRSAGDVAGWDVGTQPEPTAGSTEDKHGRHSADWHRRQRDMRMIEVAALKNGS